MHHQHGKSDKNYKQQDWSWLDRWMAAKSWETGSMDTVPPQMTPFSRKSEELVYFPDSVRTRKNNVTTRISAQQISCSPSSSESVYDEYSATTSSSSSAAAATGEEIGSKPSYMHLTASIKAKQRTSGGGKNLPMADGGKTAVVENREMMSNSTGSENSGRLCRDMYQEVSFGRRDWARCWRAAAVEYLRFEPLFFVQQLVVLFVFCGGEVWCVTVFLYIHCDDRGKCVYMVTLNTNYMRIFFLF